MIASSRRARGPRQGPHEVRPTRKDRAKRPTLLNAIASDWRDRTPPAVARALVGAAFTALPGFDERLGAAALAAFCVVLAGFMATAAVVTARSEAARSWPLNAIDALTIAMVVPVATVAARISVADPRLGGTTPNVLAACVMVSATLAIVAGSAALLSARDPDGAAIVFLPAALTAAALVAGASRFASDNLGQGLAAAWILAAVATVASGLLGRRWSGMMPLATFGALAVFVTLLNREGGESVERAHVALAFAVTAFAGAALLVAPVLAAGAGRAIVDRSPVEDDSSV